MAFDIQAYDNREALYDTAAHLVSDKLQQALLSGPATLLLSGGSTPSPVYQRLSDDPLDWTRVHVGLVDERWVENDHPASNERLVYETLLTGKAAEALFYPMKTPDADPGLAVPRLNKAYEPFNAPDVVILGMGPDGHTASWFPNATGLKEAMSPDAGERVAAINAAGAPVAGDYPDRMTITFPVVIRAKHVFLLITGDEKRDTLQAESANLPIHNLFDQMPGKIETLWAP